MVPALVETLGHLRLALTAIPTTLKRIVIDVRDGAAFGSAPELPSGRQANEPASRAVGDARLDAGEELLLPLPSALIAHSTHYQVNAAHPQAQTHLRKASIEPIWIDPRFY